MEQVNYNLIDDCLIINRQYIEKLPYHLNIIEELHSNENAHSRILAKLLQYKNHHGFVIYESFLNFIVSRNQDKDFHKITIHNPCITQEEERIDVWIRDEKNYAIIIENKIYEAGDQNEQIKRYIEITKKYGFDDNSIFVLYMPSFRRETSNQTWGKYKEAFTNRFAVVSFNEDILEWLKNYVLPNVTIKEVYLRSAIEQYIDFLEGYSSRREQTQKEELLSLILNKIGLEQSATSDEQYHHIMSLHRTLDKVRSRCDDTLRRLKDIVINEFDLITKNFYQQKGMVCKCKEGFYYQILKKEWESKLIHFEWNNFTVDSLFDNQRFTFEIHVEGDREFQKTLTDVISNMLNEDNSSSNSYPTCYQKSYYIPNKKNSFAELSTDEKKSFLEGVYNDFMRFVDVIDKALEPVQNPNEKE